MGAHCMRGAGLVVMSTALVLLTWASQAAAQQPSFPFLQDGGARESFVRSTMNSCIKTQIAAPENKGISQELITKFCSCYARAMADIINGQEYEALAAGEITDTFRKKVNSSSALCTPKSN
jgi:hypothetical protein